MNLMKVLAARNVTRSSISQLRCFTAKSQVKESESAKKTSLFDFHEENGGKMVNFAGYLLPVQYTDLSITGSHIQTRKHSSVFDVSHMLQTFITGKDAIECFETICTADVQGLAKGSGALTVFTNQQGGILDDLIVTKINSRFLFIVSNAGRKEHDSGLMLNTVDAFRAKGKVVDIKFFDPLEKALLAFQGPDASRVLQSLTPKTTLNELYFMTSTEAEVAGVSNCRITRCGYTGEDGFEISIPAEKGNFIAEALLDSKIGSVKMAGLGARDSLRLEAGLCLYGSDIDETTTPIEAGLAWLVAKRRREARDFPGADIILNQLKNGCTKRRVGVRLPAGPPARHGVEIFSTNNEPIGEITSGCPSPSLGGNVAMGYVKEDFKKLGTKVNLKIRDKFFAAEITKMPFLTSNYYQKPK